MKKLLLFSGTGVCVSIFLACLVSAIINSKKSKESVGILKNVDISRSSFLISHIIVRLNQTVLKREPKFRSHYFVTLEEAFQELKNKGKATEEEVALIKEFEKAMDSLSDSIKKMSNVHSLELEF